MDYYEELGVSQSAEAEEIRQAHRRVARLFHPDQIQNEELRRMAELQMKRLNEVCAVLCDPHRRLQYDLSLAARKLDGRAVPARPPFAGFLSREPVWMAAVVGCVLLASWVLTGFNSRGGQTQASPLPELAVTEYGPTRTHPVAPQAPDAATAVVTEELEKLRQENIDLRREVDRRIDQRDAAMADSEQLRDELARLQPTLIPQLAGPEIPAPTDIVAPSVEEPPISQQAESPTLAGTWFYVPTRSPDSSTDLYPPEYIEASINHADGLVSGRYRGVYRVTDRPISPEVVFEFRGSENDGNSYPWAGPGGAIGEVWFKLQSNGSLRVSWVASKLGSQMGLASGSAVLVKQR